MARTTPVVQAETVTWSRDRHEHQLTVGTPAWYAWLEEVSTFAFVSDRGTFTARKETRQHGSAYWKAYRKREGKLHRAYLGKSRAVTLQRLNAVAAQLSGQGDAPDRWASGNEMVQAHQASITPLPTNVIVTQRFASPESAPKHDLPLQLTSFVGREQEVIALCHTLRRPDVRLLTLTGVAGVGKTRLALQVSAQFFDDFADGMLFVSLAPINDSDLVVATIARAIGFTETAQQSLLVLLKAFLAQKHLLLVLDNFEQVIQAAPLLAELLEACPLVKLLVTSRELLRLRAEHHYVVAPLALPDLKHLPDVQGMSQYAAVALFLQRAQVIQPDFQVTMTNARVIAEICIRLEGLPLAIELAVARVKLLSLPALLARLEQRLELLTSGARDLPERQQTLHTTIQWSYDLLSTQEQALFRSLSIFVKGCTLEAVKEVCPLDGDRIVDRISSLIDKSLVQSSTQADGERRLSMLETIREYGLTCLHASGEMEIKRRAHARYYLMLAEEAEPHLRAAGQMIWSRTLESELENLRAALAYLIEREETESALRLSGALWRFWYLYGYWNEGARWLELILHLPGTESQEQLAMRARALYSAAMLTHRQGEAATTQAFLQESLRLFRTVDDKRDLAELLSMLGTVASQQNDLMAARMWWEESARVAREIDDSVTLTYSLLMLSMTTHYQGDPANTAPLIEESMVLFQKLGNAHRLWLALTLLAYSGQSSKSFLRAATLAQQRLVSIEDANNPGHINWVLVVMAGLPPSDDDTIQRGEYAQEDWSRLYDMCSKTYLAMAVNVSGWIKQHQGDFEQAEELHRESLALETRRSRCMAYSSCAVRLHTAIRKPGQCSNGAWRRPY